MRKKMTTAGLLLAFSLPITLAARADDWSLGVGTGPFLFGDFVERRLRPVADGTPGDPITLTLSAATRAGLSVDIEHSFAERWAIRAEATFTRSKLKLKQSGDRGVTFGFGEITVTTLTLPIVFRINPNGTFRAHVMGGPAYAMYDTEPPAHTPDLPIGGQTSNEWGLAFGGGVDWWLSDRFAIEGNLTDIITTSPYDEIDDTFTPGVTVKKPHNVHTTIGVRWKF